jgi:hypothetical protein
VLPVRIEYPSAGGEALMKTTHASDYKKIDEAGGAVGELSLLPDSSRIDLEADKIRAVAKSTGFIK